MATDTFVVMEKEGNGFDDIYAISDSNSTLDEPIASWELPINQRLLLGWSFGKWASIKYVRIIFATFFYPFPY